MSLINVDTMSFMSNQNSSTQQVLLDSAIQTQYNNLNFLLTILFVATF